MVKALILRAAGVGALGGLLAFVFARVFAEPLVQRAIDYESARDEATSALAVVAGTVPDSEGPEIFSRAVQANVGLGAGVIFFGLAVGLFFGVAYCMAYGRFGVVSPSRLARRVALGGFLALYLVPFLKYPANPPAIGNPDTIAQRAGLYGVMVVVSVLAAVVALWAGRALLPRVGPLGATSIAAVGFVLVVGVAMILLPPLGSLAANDGLTGASLTETPQPLTDPSGRIVYPGFDPDLLYDFRLYSVGAQMVLWTVLGLVFGMLADRVERRGDKDAEAALVAAG